MDKLIDTIEKVTIKADDDGTQGIELEFKEDQTDDELQVIKDFIKNVLGE